MNNFLTGVPPKDACHINASNNFAIPDKIIYVEYVTFRCRAVDYKIFFNLVTKYIALLYNF